MKSLSSFFLIFLFSMNVFAQEVVNIQADEKIGIKDSADPKTTMIQNAVEKVSLENISAFIGAEKMKANEKKIKEKIIAQSSKYILSLMTNRLLKDHDQYTMQVEMKLSLKNLRALLLEEGLLYQMEGTPSVLPVVRVSDQVSLQTYSWWDASGSSNSSFAKGAFDLFTDKLEEELKNTNFRLKKFDTKKLNPNFSGDKLSLSEALKMTESYKAAVLLNGEISFSPKEKSGAYVVNVHITAFQALNGRIMADVVRQYVTAPGSYRSVIVPKFREIMPEISSALAVQLEDAWKKGTFGTQQYKLIVKSEIGPIQLESFKKTLLIKIRDIKGIRERILRSGGIVYDIDSSVTPQELAQSLRSQQLPQFKVEVGSVENNEIELEVKSL